MAEGTYEYECMRAELLGVGIPDREEFLQRKREAEENQRLAAEVEEEAVEAANLQEAEAHGEALKGTGGKLEELNSILSKTQKRLDRFKVRCGSVTELIKTKIGGSINAGNGEPEPSSTTDSQQTEEAAAVVETELAQEVGERQSQLSRAMDNHVDKLDCLLKKADRAEMALSSQNKQIKSYLK